MKRGIVFEIEKFATHDGPGIRTVVFLKGCPLRCKWCHSPESWNYAIEKYRDGETIGREMTSAEVLSEVLKDRDFYEVSGGGITLSGGEPLAQSDFAIDILRLAKEHGISTAIETSGFAPIAVIDAILPFVDVWLFDVKELDPKRHLKYTKRPLEPILTNLHRISNTLKLEKPRVRRLVLRCPMIPRLNDDENELQKIAKLADSLDAVDEIDIEPYIPYGIAKAERLGIEIYRAPQPPPSYGREIITRLTHQTNKRINLP